MVLAYRHGFHCGNHGDVLKHAVLSLLISRKCAGAPIQFIDTHASAPLHSLNDTFAAKNKEYLSGISRLWTRHDHPPSLFPYIYAIRALNDIRPLHAADASRRRRYPQFALPESPVTWPLHATMNNTLRWYGGSTAIYLMLKRPTDALVCNELHPADFAALKQYIRSAQNAQSVMQYPYRNEQSSVKTPSTHALSSGSASRLFHAHNADAFWLIPSLLKPPPYHNGIVLIDPPYEIDSEYAAAAKLFITVTKLWPLSTVILWYPILTSNKAVNKIQLAKDMIHTVQDNVAVTTMRVEMDLLTLTNTDSTAEQNGNVRKRLVQLSGSALLIANPPTQLHDILNNELLPYLKTALSNDRPHMIKSDVSWLHQQVRSTTAAPPFIDNFSSSQAQQHTRKLHRHKDILVSSKPTSSSSSSSPS